MSKLRNPFAIRNGEIIMIEDLPKSENGFKCNCFCPACNDKFEARLGTERIHHFAHSGKGCDEVNAYLTGIYRLLKEYFDLKIPLFLPDLVATFYYDNYLPLTKENVDSQVKIISAYHGTANEILVAEGKYYIFDNAEIITKSNGHAEAILLKIGSNKLALKITPPSTVCKNNYVRRYEDIANRNQFLR